MGFPHILHVFFRIYSNSSGRFFFFLETWLPIITWQINMGRRTRDPRKQGQWTFSLIAGLHSWLNEDWLSENPTINSMLCVGLGSVKWTPAWSENWHPTPLLSPHKFMSFFIWYAYSIIWLSYNLSFATLLSRDVLRKRISIDPAMGDYYPSTSTQHTYRLFQWQSSRIGLAMMAPHFGEEPHHHKAESPSKELVLCFIARSRSFVIEHLFIGTPFY